MPTWFTFALVGHEWWLFLRSKVEASFAIDKLLRTHSAESLSANISALLVFLYAFSMVLHCSYSWKCHIYLPMLAYSLLLLVGMTFWIDNPLWCRLSLPVHLSHTLCCVHYFGMRDWVWVVKERLGNMNIAYSMWTARRFLQNIFRSIMRLVALSVDLIL